MLPCYCAQTRRAARLLTQRYDAELREADVSASQFELLTLLAFGQQHGRGIASRLGLDTTTVSRNLKPLIAAKLVSATISDQDARLTIYSLTTEGIDRQRKAAACWQKAQDKILKTLGREGSTVLQALQRLTYAASTCLSEPVPSE